MKKILLSIAATAALTAAVAPAVAQPYGYQGRGGYGYDNGRGGGLEMGYYDSLSSKVQIAAQERRISWGQAQSLRNQLSQLHDAAWRVHTGEARSSERQRVAQVIARAESVINSGYGRGYAQRDRYDDRYNDRYNDRSWGR